MPSQAWFMNWYSEPTADTLRLIDYFWESRGPLDVHGLGDYHPLMPAEIARRLPGLQREGIDQVMRRVREV